MRAWTVARRVNRLGGSVQGPPAKRYETDQRWARVNQIRSIPRGKAPNAKEMEHQRSCMVRVGVSASSDFRSLN
jgi:hypothetical protein